MKTTARANNNTDGFTIVEILVTIVVITVLVALTYVSYTAIANNSRKQAVSTDLQTTATELTKFKADNGGFPNSVAFSDIKTSDTSGKTTYRYVPEATLSGYCLEATGYNATFRIVSGSTEVVEGPCPEV